MGLKKAKNLFKTHINFSFRFSFCAVSVSLLLTVEEFFCLILRVTGQIHTELAERVRVRL